MRRSRVGSFLIGFCLMLCVLGLAGACLLAEVHMQKTSYGQAESPVASTLEAGRLRLYRIADGETLELPAALRERLVSLIAAPVQGLHWLLQQESAGLEWVWDRVEQLLSGDMDMGNRRSV